MKTWKLHLSPFIALWIYTPYSPQLMIISTPMLQLSRKTLLEDATVQVRAKKIYKITFCCITF